MKVLTFGTFDVYHPGHEFYLRNSKSYGKELHVLVARDLTVKKIKGKYPKNSETYRLKNILMLDFVKNAYLGHKEDFYSILDKIKPDVICLGYDQKDFTLDLLSEIKKRKLKTKIVRIAPFRPDIYKSSKFKGVVELN